MPSLFSASVGGQKGSFEGCQEGGQEGEEREEVLLAKHLQHGRSFSTKTTFHRRLILDHGSGVPFPTPRALKRPNELVQAIDGLQACSHFLELLLHAGLNRARRAKKRLKKQKKLAKKAACIHENGCSLGMFPPYTSTPSSGL